MSSSSQPDSYYIGWDVGGWNCDKTVRTVATPLCILDVKREIVGRPWRGNLRHSINQAADTADWLGRLFLRCAGAGAGAALPGHAGHRHPAGLSPVLDRLADTRANRGIDQQLGTNPIFSAAPSASPV